MASSNFWDAYPDFTSNPNAPIIEEFNRLAGYRNWRQGSKAYKKAYNRCMAMEFSAHYGHDATKLEGWQSLCREVRVRNVPSSITQCRKVLSGIWVNLVDLIDCRRTGAQVPRFKNKGALRNYSISQKRIFPKEAAKRDGFIKQLLIDMFGDQ